MSTRAPELPGRYCFPPFAAVITGAARLILAMLERCVSDAGGSWVFCDTDSMAVVTDYSASEGPAEGEGLSDRPDALSIETIDGIVGRFSPLSLYEFGGSILKIEDENYADDGCGERAPLYAYAVSAKRYVLLNFGRRDGRYVRKVSEHGLGTYQPPHGH